MQSVSISTREISKSALPEQILGLAKTLPRLGKNSLISGIDRNRCQNRKVSIVSIVLSILSQYLPKAIAILTPPSDIPNDYMIYSLI